MKILITILLLISTFLVIAYAGLNLISVTLPTAMTLEQACKIYQEMWDNSTIQSVGNLNKGKLEFQAGDTFKYFEIVGKGANGNDVLVATIETSALQVASGIYTCNEMSELCKVSPRVFRLANPAINCP